LKKRKEFSKTKVKFLVWLGKQNVFLVFATLFLLIYGSTKTFAYFFSDAGLDKNNTNKSSVKVMELPKATLSPIIKKQDFDSVPFIHPSSSPTISPTIDSDPMIDCKIPDNCGGGTVQIKQSECFSKVCCPVNEEKYETLTYDECHEKQAEFLKKQNEDYQKRLNEEYQNYLDAYNKNTAEKQDQYNDELTEYKSQLLEQCRSNAQTTYKQKPIGSTTNSDTGAYVVGESQIIREQLNKALQTCNDLYGN